jgi:hypothetical protein
VTQLNLDEIREWLEIVYSEMPGKIHICGTREWAGKTFATSDVDGALAYIRDLDQRPQVSDDNTGMVPREGVYLRATTLHHEPPPNQRGGDDLSFYLPGLWGDIDIAGPGHKTKGTLPPDSTAAINIVAMSGLPEPSHWIHSGGGLYPWWLLRTPAEITDLEDFRALSQGWQNALLRGALALGYQYGSGVGDLSRVLRIPGTVNRKAGLERPCTALGGNYAWGGPLYTLDELHDALAKVTPEPPKPSPIEVKISKVGSRDGERPGDEFNRTADWYDILLPHGWQWVRKMGYTWYLRRPGKLSGGHSATLRTGTDRLWVFSEEAHPFQAFRLYDKFSAYAVLEHNGDFAAAARALGSKGYGQQRPARPVGMAPSVPATPSMEVPAPIPPAPVVPAAEPIASPAMPTTPGVSRGETRNVLVGNEDRWFVLQNLTKELTSRWDKDRLFTYGGVICERDGFTMRPLNRARLDSIAVETCQVVNRKFDARRKEGEQERLVAAPIEARMLDMVLARPEQFSRLDKLSQIPFVRPDGTICSTPGYDESTRTFLELDPCLTGIAIPEKPTKDQVTWARGMLLEELLGDFPLDTEADKANALATLITPFIRDLIPTSPLAVIDAKEAGSGKNLMADVISILTTGNAAQTLPYTTDNEEQRKVITSAFRSGNAMLLFDEAHHLEGTAFARALTSHSYQDRVLGTSEMAEFPNNRTWIALGNQVQIKGDMGRRVYRVRLEYPGARPESRDASQFRHPDLRQWAMDNRGDLVRACLIMVRAWFALDKPAATLPFRMGSFERWQETLAGILWVAGVPGLLENTRQWRAESDFERQHQVAHLWWLQVQFGSGEFTSGQVTDALRRNPEAPRPDGMDDAFGEGYSRRLGQCYARLKDRILDGFQLVKSEATGHNNVTKWKIRKIEEDPDDSGA